MRLLDGLGWCLGIGLTLSLLVGGIPAKEPQPLPQVNIVPMHVSKSINLGNDTFLLVWTDNAHVVLYQRLQSPKPGWIISYYMNHNWLNSSARIVEIGWVSASFAKDYPNGWWNACNKTDCLEAHYVFSW